MDDRLVWDVIKTNPRLSAVKFMSYLMQLGRPECSDCSRL